MLYVGLDMSLTGSGVSTKEGTNVFVTTIKTAPKDFKNDLERYRYIVEKAFGYIKETPDKTFICIEDVFVPQNKMQINAAMKLIGLAYLIRSRLYEAGYKFYIPAPSQVKKFVSGKGTCPKDQVTKEVYKRWGVDTKDDNQADACCMAYFAEALHAYLQDEKSVLNLPKAQAEVIKAVALERPAYNVPNAVVVLADE